MNFSDIFTGSRGLCKTLASLLGGSATVIFAAKGEYHPDTDFTAGLETEATVGWIPDPRDSSAAPPSLPGGARAGLAEERNRIAGYVPYSDLAECPDIVPERDAVAVNGIRYRITSARTMCVQNSPVMVYITAIR